jgi:hypothetical protein
MRERGIEVAEREIDSLALSLPRERTSESHVISKTAAQIRSEAKRKLVEREAITRCWRATTSKTQQPQ